MLKHSGHVHGNDGCSMRSAGSYAVHWSCLEGKGGLQLVPINAGLSFGCVVGGKLQPH
jgi:hypothetical protein